MRLPLTILLASLIASPVLADSHGNDFVHSRKFKGQVYVMYQTHMSLYTFANDGVGKSNCYDTCAQNWPPALLDDGTALGKNYSLIQRTDGTMQAAFRGQPLYLYIGDENVGDTNGDGVANLWVLARP